MNSASLLLEGAEETTLLDFAARDIRSASTGRDKPRWIPDLLCLYSQEEHSGEVVKV